MIAGSRGQKGGCSDGGCAVLRHNDEESEGHGCQDGQCEWNVREDPCGERQKARGQRCQPRVYAPHHGFAPVVGAAALAPLCSLTLGAPPEEL